MSRQTGNIVASQRGGVHSDATAWCNTRDLLDKPHDHGGLEISRYVASGILAAIIVALILILPPRAGMHPGAREQKA